MTNTTSRQESNVAHSIEVGNLRSLFLPQLNVCKAGRHVKNSSGSLLSCAPCINSSPKEERPRPLSGTNQLLGIFVIGLKERSRVVKLFSFHRSPGTKNPQFGNKIKINPPADSLF